MVARHFVSKSGKKALSVVHKLLKRVSKMVFGSTSKVIKKSGTGAKKILGKIGKLSKPLKLDNGAIQYTFNQGGKGIVIVTGATANLVNSAGKVSEKVLDSTKNLGVVVLTGTSNVISKLTRGAVKIGGKKSRKKKKSRRRRKSHKGGKRKNTRRRNKRKNKKKSRRRRRR